MIMGSEQARIRTYGTSANFLGIYDDAGFKVGTLYTTTTATKSKDGLAITSTGSIPVPTDETNLSHVIWKKLLDDRLIERCGLVLDINNSMKKGGLGTSAAGAVAFVELVDKLYGLSLSPAQKIFYASRSEPNHLDNVLPWVLGGITFSYRARDNKDLPYERFDPPPNLHSALVVPLDIEKDGGTAGARNALADLQHTDAEESRIVYLKATAIEAVKGNDFTSLRGVAHEFLKWDRSETFIRNEKGVYKIDIREINKILERHYGGKALLLPSGAGPTLVIHADEQEITDRAAEDVVGVYKSGFHSAAAYPAPIRSQPSIDDFVE